MLEYSYYHCVHGSLLCAVYAVSSDPLGWTSRSSQSVKKARCRCLKVTKKGTKGVVRQSEISAKCRRRGQKELAAADLLCNSPHQGLADRNRNRSRDGDPNVVV